MNAHETLSDILMNHVRESVIAAVRGTRMPTPPVEGCASEFLSRRCGVFVSIKRNGELRGCIGRIESDTPLSDTLSEIAAQAALSDPRFPPVTIDELDLITLELSVLTEPIVIDSLDKIRPGIDGIIVSGEGRRGCYLPQVGAETGWSAGKFVRHCLREKAGLPETSVEDGKASVEVFQAEIFHERQ